MGLGLHCKGCFLGKFEGKYVFDNSKKQQAVKLRAIPSFRQQN